MSSHTFPAAVLLNSTRLRLVFSSPKVRPPLMEEILPDVARLARLLAAKRSDASCPLLNESDLYGECMYKFSSLICGNKFKKIRTREEAFRYIKTMFNNHLLSMVAKYRGTLKRGGKKDTDSIEEGAMTKSVDVNADDPDLHIQIADPTSNWCLEDSFIADNAMFFTPVEILVLREYSDPGPLTRFHAEYRALRCKDPADGLKIKFSVDCYAAGLGLETSALKKILTNLKIKISWIIMNSADDAEILWNRSIRYLEGIFCIQIPKSVEKQVIRRLLTMAAADQYDKIADDAIALECLKSVGAKVPEKRAGRLVCFGVMYQKTHRSCQACGLNQSCAAEAATFGLGEITIDSRLLGSKQMRVPVVVSPEKQSPVPLLTADHEEVYHCLQELFSCGTNGREFVFKHRDTNQVCVTMQTVPEFQIRFFRASDELKSKLVQNGPSFSAPADCDVETLIELINHHANSTFSGS